MKELMKRRCIPFLQSYARIEREKAIEDFDRKMKLWRWIHDSSDNAPPPGFQERDTGSGRDEPPAKQFKQGRQARPGKEPKEIVRRRRGPRPKLAEPTVRQTSTASVVKSTTPVNNSGGSNRWRNRNQREDIKRIVKPSRIIRERLDSTDWQPVAEQTPQRDGEHKRIRLTYTEEQVEILRDAFEQEHYASREVKEELADRTGLSVTQVNKWFENRRKRERDEQKARTHP